MPNSAMSGYGQFARVLAGIWLLFQIIILLDFIYDVNEWLLKKVSNTTKPGQRSWYVQSNNWYTTCMAQMSSSHGLLKMTQHGIQEA